MCSVFQNFVTRDTVAYDCRTQMHSTLFVLTKFVLKVFNTISSVNYFLYRLNIIFNVCNVMLKNPW